MLTRLILQVRNLIGSRHLLRLGGIGAVLLMAMTTRSQAQTDYYYYSNDYRNDHLGSGWQFNTDGMGDWEACEAPGDPGYLTGGDNLDFSTVYYDQGPGGPLGFDFYHDTYTDEWISDIYGDNVWYGWRDPSASTNCLHYYDATNSTDYLYDQISGTWADNFYSGVGDYYPLDGGPGGPDDIYLVGGEEWTTYNVDDVDYAYDSGTGDWYVDVGPFDEFNGDAWESSSSPF